MEHNGIQKFAIFLVVLGIVSAIICGFVFQVIPADYLAKNLEYPTIYPLEEAHRVFNWTYFLITLSSSVLCGFFFYCLGSIIQRQDKIIYEIQKTHNVIHNESHVNEPISSSPLHPTNGAHQ